MHILLVEDNQENADMTIRILESAGHTVKHCLRGLEASQSLREERPDVVLMDFDLPDIDGRTMALLMKRRRVNERDAPPIIAVTARTGVSEMKMAERFGCDGFISKPFLPDELLNMIVEVVARGSANTST